MSQSHTHIFFFIFFSIMICQRILNLGPCAIKCSCSVTQLCLTLFKLMQQMIRNRQETTALDRVESLKVEFSFLFKAINSIFKFIGCAGSSWQCMGFSSCSAQAWQLWCVGLVAPRHVGSLFPDQELNRVPCIGRWMLDQWTTRKSLEFSVFQLLFTFIYLLLSALGLHTVRAVFSCGAWGLLSSCGCSLLMAVALSLWSTGSRARGLSSCCTWAQQLCCADSVCGIFQDQGSNWCPLHCKVDSQPLDHQGSPWNLVLALIYILHHYIVAKTRYEPDNI